MARVREAVQALGESEVKQLKVGVREGRGMQIGQRPLEHEVGGLHIAVDDGLLAQVTQRVHQLRKQAACLGLPTNSESAGEGVARVTRRWRQEVGARGEGAGAEESLQTPAPYPPCPLTRPPW